MTLEALAQGQAEPAPAVGLGTPGLADATLVTLERVAHLMAFPAAGRWTR